MSQCALHLRVSFVADQNGFTAVLQIVGHFHVNLGYQRTSRVEDLETTLLGFAAHRPGHAVGAEDDRGVVGHLRELLDEHRALIGEIVHHVLVVHHLVAHVDGRTENAERPLDNLDGAIDAGAEATWIGQQDFHLRLSGLRNSDAG